jgi:hypothetical protein
MTAILTEAQRQIVQSGDGFPVEVIDEQTQQVYYLITSAQFERVQALLAADPHDPSELYPLISRTAADAGWNDPLMDDYDRYDELRSQH